MGNDDLTKPTIMVEEETTTTEEKTIDEPVEDEVPATEETKERPAWYDEVKKDNDSLQKKNKIKGSLLFGVLLMSGVAIAFLLQIKQGLVINEGVNVTAAALSIAVNVLLLLGVFGTGIGQGLIRTFKKRLTFGSGRYVNTLLVSKNGPIREHYTKVDQETGSFKINGNTHTRNPGLLHNFHKIPTYIHLENNADPIDIFGVDTNNMSTKEIDRVMSSMDAFDVRQWLSKNALIIGVALFIILAAICATVFFGVEISQMLKEGTYMAKECIIKPTPIVAGTL